MDHLFLFCQYIPTIVVTPELYFVIMTLVFALLFKGALYLAPSKFCCLVLTLSMTVNLGVKNNPLLFGSEIIITVGRKPGKVFFPEEKIKADLTCIGSSRLYCNRRCYCC